MVEKTKLSDKAQKFISDCLNFNETSCFSTQMKDVGNKNWNSFMEKCYFAHYYDNCENKIDEALGLFMRKILDKKFFGVSLQHPFELKVNHYDCVVIANICAIYLELSVILISEEKLGQNTPINQGEAQAIAKAIAVCQQSQWPNGKIIYFFKTRGFHLTFYSACFDKLFSIQNGIQFFLP